MEGIVISFHALLLLLLLLLLIFIIWCIWGKICYLKTAGQCLMVYVVFRYLTIIRFERLFFYINVRNIHSLYSAHEVLHIA